MLILCLDPRSATNLRHPPNLLAKARVVAPRVSRHGHVELIVKVEAIRNAVSYTNSDICANVSLDAHSPHSPNLLVAP